MDEYHDYDSPEEEQADGASSSGPTLPGGISLKTAATAVLIVAVAAILWMAFVGPRSSEPPGLATPTPGSGAGAVVSATLPAPWTPGTPGAAASAGLTGTAQAGAASIATMPATVAAAPTSAIGTAVAIGTAPAALTTGGFVRVTGSGADGIRYRYGPGLTFITIRIVSDGEVLRALGGPESSDGYSWYRLQDDKGNVGWAARQYLEPIAAPGVWSPPAASPTFRAGSAGSATATSPPGNTSP